MNNFQYFEYSQKNPEELFDSFYKKNKIVIPANNTENELTENNKKMIDYITTFKVLISQKFSIKDKSVEKVVMEIVNILTSTLNINYSAFTQFFMVYNSTYSYFKGLTNKDKFTFVYDMLIKYCNERHDMYLNHGYTNTILQVVCDSYSHKRNGKTSIDKVLTFLSPHNLKRIRDISLTDDKNYYFLPDKGDKKLFEEFITKYNLKMESRKIEQNKLPDIVFNCNGQFYICELKTMKGNGGGQNKQIVEVAYFIQFTEDDDRFHYLTFLDSDYSNILFSSKRPKITNQRTDIIKALNENKRNYFVNTAGLKKLIEDIFK